MLVLEQYRTIMTVLVLHSIKLIPFDFIREHLSPIRLILGVVLDISFCQ